MKVFTLLKPYVKMWNKSYCTEIGVSTDKQLHNTLAIFFMKTTANKGNNKITELRTILKYRSDVSNGFDITIILSEVKGPM
jgi:hypothetical protein